MRARLLVAKDFICYKPTGTDSKTGDKVEQLLFDLNRQTTLVMVTHDTTLAKRRQRILNMEAARGGVARCGIKYRFATKQSSAGELTIKAAIILSVTAVLSRRYL